MARYSLSNIYLSFVLLLLLHHNGKLSIPNDNMFLLLKILHLVLFKSLQRQDYPRISGDSHVVFWWDRYGNHRLSFLRRADLPFVWNGFFAILFSYRQFQKNFLLVLQQCGEDCVVISSRSTPFNISDCAIDLIDGAQFKCKRKR